MSSFSSFCSLKFILLPLTSDLKLRYPYDSQFRTISSVPAGKSTRDDYGYVELSPDKPFMGPAQTLTHSYSPPSAHFGPGDASYGPNLNKRPRSRPQSPLSMMVAPLKALKHKLLGNPPGPPENKPANSRLNSYPMGSGIYPQGYTTYTTLPGKGSPSQMNSVYGYYPAKPAVRNSAIPPMPTTFDTLYPRQQIRNHWKPRRPSKTPFPPTHPKRQSHKVPYGSSYYPHKPIVQIQTYTGNSTLDRESESLFLNFLFLIKAIWLRHQKLDPRRDRMDTPQPPMMELDSLLPTLMQVNQNFKLNSTKSFISYLEIMFLDSNVASRRSMKISYPPAETSYGGKWIQSKVINISGTN